MKKDSLIGDVFEIATASGLAYVQVSHRHKRYGHLVRVLPGFYSKRPEDLAAVVQLEESLTVFANVRSLVRSGALTLVGNLDVPAKARNFPIFRARAEGLGDADWYKWDGEKDERIGKMLPESYKDLPKRGVYSDDYFVDLVARGVRNRDLPEHDPP